MPETGDSTTYVATVSGETVTYALEAGTLSAESKSTPGMKHAISLDAPGVTAVEERRFHNLFWAGLAALGVPAFTLSVIYLKETKLDVYDIWSLVHVGFMIVGTVLMLAYRRRRRGLLVTRDGRTGIVISCEPGKEAGYREFCEAVAAAIRSAGGH
ncbi:MAG: hypothetical protein ACYS9X_13910 [Planctomycetota bacterium]|jgi:hypothetical protein